MPRKKLGVNTGTNRDRLRAFLAGAREQGARRAWLTCEENHTWASEIDPRSEDRAGVVDPTCGRCGRFYADCRVVEVEHDESVVCGLDCRRATKPKCRCSCGGAYHGVDGALAEAPAA